MPPNAGQRKLKLCLRALLVGCAIVLYLSAALPHVLTFTSLADSLWFPAAKRPARLETGCRRGLLLRQLRCSPWLGGEPLAHIENDNLDAFLRHLDDAYEGGLTNPDPVENLDEYGDSYGEVLPSGVITIFREFGAQPGQLFYDLGSGTGKVSLLMWLLGLRVTGIERNPSRWQAACSAAARLRDMVDANRLQELGSHQQLEFARGSFLEMDLSDANFIMASLTNDAKLHDELTYKLATTKEGTRILSPYPFIRSPSWNVINSKPQPVFSLVKKFKVSTTWSARGVSTLFLHERVGPPVITRRFAKSCTVHSASQFWL